MHSPWLRYSIKHPNAKHRPLKQGRVCALNNRYNSAALCNAVVCQSQIADAHRAKVVSQVTPAHWKPLFQRKSSITFSFKVTHFWNNVLLWNVGTVWEDILVLYANAAATGRRLLAAERIQKALGSQRINCLEMFAHVYSRHLFAAPHQLSYCLSKNKSSVSVTVQRSTSEWCIF